MHQRAVCPLKANRDGNYALYPVYTYLCMCMYMHDITTYTHTHLLCMGELV